MDKAFRQGKKVLIVLDQFEQWLHAKKEEENTVLVQALRQCEGSRVQCIVMVRDDFWMAAPDSCGIWKFDLSRHRTRPPWICSRSRPRRESAYGLWSGVRSLAGQSSKLGKDQKEFLEQAVRGLAQEGKVVCVRLALFAEMMKGKAWTPATLKDVGGTEGVGVTFLEETFSAASAPPEHRYHQKAARAVLKACCPNPARTSRATCGSHAELLAASGYANRPKDFDDLLRILDSELRLITPTDPEGKEGIDDPRPRFNAGQKYYQLTHDYLVPSLRDWLTRKQKETRRGRAELLLADRTELWNTQRTHGQSRSVRCLGQQLG